MAADLEAAARRYRHSGSEDARQDCLEMALSLVKRVWSGLRVSLPPSADGLAEDLLQCGVIGLMQALDSWKVDGGASFETWARLRIRGAMLDELRRLDWISKQRRHRWKGLQAAVRELEQSLQRCCSEDELAQHLGLSLDGLREVLLENAPGSMVFLDGLGSEDKPGLHERIADARQKGSDESLADSQLKDHLKRAIRDLPVQEHRLLALLLDEDLGHKEAAAVLGVTPGRVSQIYAKAILHLQAALARHTEP